MGTVEISGAGVGLTPLEVVQTTTGDRGRGGLALTGTGWGGVSQTTGVVGGSTTV